MIKKNSTVLIIEDNSNIRQATAKILEILDFSTIQTVSRDEGWSVLQDNQKIGLILMDVSMEGMTLETFIDKINHNNYNLPIILTSGMPDTELSSILKKDQFYFLSKPYGMDELEVILNKI